MTETTDEATLAALGTARVVLYGLQFEKGPLARRVNDTVHEIAKRGGTGSQSRESVIRNLRNAAALEGSLKDRIGFIDRPEDEIRSFLSAVAEGLETQANIALAGPINGASEPPPASSGQAGAA